MCPGRMLRAPSLLPQLQPAACTSSPSEGSVHGPSAAVEYSNLIAEHKATLTSITSRLLQAAYLLKFSIKQAKKVHCTTGVYLQTAA